MAETLEITTLRPAAGRTAEDFVEANADIDTYLRRRPGFLWRRIVETDDGRIIDVVAYDSLPHARAARPASPERWRTPPSTPRSTTAAWTGRSPGRCTSHREPTHAFRRPAHQP